MTSKELQNRPVTITSLDEDDKTINFLFGYIAGTSSTKVKEEFLSQHMSPLVEQILKDTYGGRKYYIKKYEINGSGPFTIDTDYGYFHSVLDDLANRKYTGQTAIDYLVNCIEQFCTRDQVWLARILDGNLKIGVGQTFAEDSGKVGKYPCALANVLEKAKNVDILDGTWLVSRKLDGSRCHAHVDMDARTVTFISRQGKKFTTLNNLTEPVLNFMTDEGLGLTGKWVLDGEVCIMDGDKEDFRGLMSLVRRKDYTIEHPCYKVFDILTEDEFYGRAESPNFSVRYNRLVHLFTGFMNPMIDVIEQGRITSQEVLDKWRSRQKAGGWEGLMVRKDVPYEGKRTNNLLKIKPFQDSEYVVTGIIEGDMTYNTTSGSETVHGVSALTVKHKGNVVKVGTGMSKEQRLAWVANPELIIGKTITVQFFEETQDRKTGEYSLRFPTLKYVYENGRDV